MRKVILSIVTLGAMVWWDCARSVPASTASTMPGKRITPIVRIASGSPAAGLRSAAPLRPPPAIRFTAGTDPTVERPIGAALPMVAGSDRPARDD